jgi:hypothetical protein
MIHVAQNGETLLSASVTRTLVAIDSTEDFDLSGRIFNPYMQDIVAFHDMKEFLEVMENFFDDIGFPQAMYTLREFCAEKTKAVHTHHPGETLPLRQNPALFETLRGKYVTFSIFVRFRRSATWQGTVDWIEKGQSYSFHSTLELVRLIGDALDDSAGESPIGEWS